MLIHIKFELMDQNQFTNYIIENGGSIYKTLIEGFFDLKDNKNPDVQQIFKNDKILSSLKFIYEKENNIDKQKCLILKLLMSV